MFNPDFFGEHHQKILSQLDRAGDNKIMFQITVSAEDGNSTNNVNTDCFRAPPKKRGIWKSICDASETF